ncbi:hypothetical protein GCM10010441_43250 [Kitasatospora paracochleata]
MQRGRAAVPARPRWAASVVQWAQRVLESVVVVGVVAVALCAGLGGVVAQPMVPAGREPDGGVFQQGGLSRTRSADNREDGRPVGVERVGQ